MPINKDNQIKRRFTWNIHYACNYRCPYCFFDGKWVEYKKRNTYLSVDDWMKYWDEIYRKYGQSYILITGGEPFIYPDFIELIERLSQIHYPINVSTNASGDLKSFVKKIDPGKVSLSVSLQLNFEDVSSFLEKVKFLRAHRFQGCINFVAYPPFIKQVNFILERFKSIGEEIKIIPFWGKYRDKDYPFAYTDEEKEVIGINGSWFDKVRKKDSICPAGLNSALIFPDGKVARCGQIGERLLIGNFFDDGFKLLDKPLPCDAEFCPCDENELFGEKEDAALCATSKEEIKEAGIYKNVLKINTSQVNSQVNDNEYNERKAILESSPKAIFIQAAGPCNSSCVFCSRGTGYEMFDLETHQQSFKENLYPFIRRAETLILTGSGEFLRLPEAGNILDFFDATFPQVEKCFSTNASSLLSWISEKVINGRSRYTIHASLHASNAALHKTMTRMDNFEEIIQQIKYLMHIRKEKSKLLLNLVFVATTLNIEDFPDFIALAGDLGVDKVICYYNYIYVPAQKYLSCYFKQDLTNNMFDKAEDAARRAGINIELPPRFNQKSYRKASICREPFSQIMFDSHGHVLPCDASEDCREILNNGKGFMEIWNSQYYQNLRKSLIEGNCSCLEHCLRANPSKVNDFRSHVIHRGVKSSKDIDIFWGDNF